jgi:hypothetical protein
VREMLLRVRTREILGNVEVASSTGAELTGEQSNKREPRPLRDAKGLEQLLLGVFEGGRNRIHGRNRQALTSSPSDLAERYCEVCAGSNEF